MSTSHPWRHSLHGWLASRLSRRIEMIKRILVPAATLGALAAPPALPASPGFALSAKECSVKYNAAKSAGTLNGLNWNEFRKQECGSGAAGGDGNAAIKPSTGT